MGEIKANNIHLAQENQTNSEGISVGKVGGVEFFARVTLHTTEAAQVEVYTAVGGETKTIYPGRSKKMLNAVNVEHGNA